MRYIAIIDLAVGPFARLLAPVDSVALSDEDRPRNFESTQQATATAFAAACRTPLPGLVLFFNVPVSDLGG